MINFDVPIPPPKAPPKKRRGTPRPTDDPEFDRFWEAYPRRVDKGHARKAWKAARKTVEAEVLIAGAERYAAECVAARREEQFIAHASTWLNGERWGDEPAKPAVPGSTSTVGRDEDGWRIVHDRGSPIRHAEEKAEMTPEQKRFNGVREGPPLTEEERQARIERMNAMSKEMIANL